MATQRRFEAHSLAAVLAKVQKEVGPDAVISSAQRVRSGGVGGFFQREKYEVLVTEGDATNQANHGSPKAGPGAGTPSQPQTKPQNPAAATSEGTLSLMDLAELANATDVNEVKTTAAAPNNKSARIEDAIANARAIADQQQTKAEPEVQEPKVTAVSVDQPKVQAPTAEVVQTEPEPQISTESDSFAEVLSRVAFQAHMTDEHDAAQREAAAERARRRDEDLIPGRPAFLDTVETKVAETPTKTPQPQEQPQPQPQPQALATAPQTPVTADVAVPKQRTRVSDHPLAMLGLPTEFIPVGVDTEGLQEALASALERLLPKTPEIRPSKGSVIAIVGERFDAMEIAGELAEQWGRPAEEIVLASQYYRGKGAANVLRTVRSAEDAQRSWSRRPRPTIVAIEAQPGSRDSSWAEHVLTALEPIATFGVADATRKSDDIKAWADALGGIDCLAINNIEETVSPAAILSTGIPVDRVDGRRVTAAFWALLLTERLTAA